MIDAVLYPAASPSSIRCSMFIRVMADKKRPMRLLDLFCGAGGAAMGYYRAGFDQIVGVDIHPQPHYPFTFIQGDALKPPVRLEDFDLIHASPPCQAYTNLGNGKHPRLIEPTRFLLVESGRPWIIENIESAPVRRDVKLCGSMFGLGVRRHRLFEHNLELVLNSQCNHADQGEIRGYYGRNYGPALVSKDAIQRRGRKPLFRGTVEQGRSDMGIDWMTWDELRESIPPAYTEYLGRQFLDQLARL